MKNLLKIQIKESSRRGEETIKILLDSNKLEQSSTEPKNRAPRNVLQPSPINTFEGYQFQIKNAIKEVTNIKKELDIKIEHNAKINIIEPATNPSIPSMKFEKFIIAVPAIMIKKEISNEKINGNLSNIISHFINK